MKYTFPELAKKYWPVLLLGAIPLLLVALRSPAFLYYWSYDGFKRLFYEDAGWSNAWADFGATICAFAYGMIIPGCVLWFIFGSWRRLSYRNVGRAVAVLILLSIPPLTHVLWQPNFSQSDGKSRKWYVYSNGQYVLSDSPGNDP